MPQFLSLVRLQFDARPSHVTSPNGRQMIPSHLDLQSYFQDTTLAQRRQHTGSDEQELANWRGGCHAVYPLGPLTLCARLAVADA
jgi:hypothetical protein